MGLTSTLAEQGLLSTKIPSLKRPSTKRVSLKELNLRTPEISSRHITGQQLCESCRQYAIDQYGYLARIVLDSWGIRKYE